MSSQNRVKILLLIPHLGGGGAEHVMELLAASFDPERYEIHLGLVTQSPGFTGDVPASTTIHALGTRRVRYGALKIIRLIWNLRPAVILSSMAHLNVLVAMLRPVAPASTKICLRQNGTLDAATAATGYPRLARLLYKAAYRLADRILCQTSAMAKELHETLGIASAKLVVVPNPVETDRIRAVACTPNLKRSPVAKLIVVARLAHEKGIDILLEAFACLRERHPEAILEIFGDGPSRAALESQRDSLQLQSCVQFFGVVPFPAVHFSEASIFVLSSRHEGLPNALLEAAAAGLPIVSLPACRGLIDLLRGQAGVWMASNISASALATALSNAIATIRPGQRFPHAWVDDFDLEKSIPAYENVFETVLERAHP